VTPCFAQGVSQTAPCDMVTQSEMSAILGGAVAAAAGSTENVMPMARRIYETAKTRM